ncbi:RNA polymerase I-specific transcription initiation factor [Aureococcus anophagefferens]|nr:RNA polymerase I-specific transcription initiation factor [Aureococcus anophagefferens]
MRSMLALATRRRGRELLRRVGGLRGGGRRGARVAEADLPDDGTCFQWDGVELANRSYCQPCLNGSYWDEFRDARGVAARGDRGPVVVEMPYWLSGQLQASAMRRILLEEVLGYADISLASAGSGSTAASPRPARRWSPS